VGVTPTRNPELVVAVLWQNGGFSYYPARIGARVAAAYIEKQRRLAHNLVEPAKTAVPAEMSAVWTVPDSNPRAPSTARADRLQSGHFLVDHGEIRPAETSPAGPPLRQLSGAGMGQQPPQPARKPEVPTPGAGQ
jgi:hypothetical protein